MSDITEAISQEAVADSLLGPEPTQETTAEQPQAGAEAVEQPEQFEAQEAEQQTEQEQLDDWLPTEQDKVFPDEVYAKYAQRYQFSPEQASDPLIRQLLHDKINSDLWIKQQNEQPQEFQLEEPQQEPTQQQALQPLSLEQHLQAMQAWANQNTDPRIAQQFGNDFMKAFGPEFAAGAKPEVAQALTQTMTTFGLNLIQTALPQMLLPMMDQVMPGFSGMYYQSARGQAWDSVRNSDPKYGEMPAYGTKEFVTMCQQVAAANPRLTQIGLQLQAANGGELYGPRAEEFYGMLADLASRPQVDPAQVLEAAKAMNAASRRGQVRKDAGNLGAGQSKGLNNNRAVRSQFETNQDIFDDDTMAIYQREHGRI